MQKDIKKINKDIAVAMFDPEKGDFKTFKENGYKSVINLQTAEEEQNISESDEQQSAKENGLVYVHRPISKNNMTVDVVNHFREDLEKAPKPVVVHCKSGKRSGAFVMMHVACENNMSGEDAIEKANQMDFECDEPELKEFLKNYINS